MYVYEVLAIFSFIKNNNDEKPALSRSNFSKRRWFRDE